MRIGSRDRLWLLAGLVAALLLLGVAWQFFISSQNDQTSSIKQDIDSAQVGLTQAQHNLNQLKADSANIDQYNAALASARLALPSDSGMPGFLRELHSAGDDSGVGVVSIQVANAVPVSAATAAPTASASDGASAGGSAAPVATSLYQMTLTIVTNGSLAGTVNFIKQVQQVQPRAALLTAVTVSSGNGAGNFQTTIVLQVFVAPTDGQTPVAAPSPVTTVTATS